MDPAPIGSPEWAEIGKLLTNLWIVVFFVIMFAANMLLTHNLIPSLVASQHIPQRWQKVRPALYAVALICFGVAMFFLSRVVGFAGVLSRFWPSYWI